MPSIALMNNNGGVGKTTTTINLGVQAARKKRTLLVDMDEQGSLSEQFGLYDSKTTIKDALMGKPFDVVNVRKNLDVLPANDDMIGIDLQLSPMLGREKKLLKALKKIKDNYDYIFIDCPSNTSLVTINALVFSDYVILPILLDSFSTNGIDKMINFIASIKEDANPDLSVLGILITQYEKGTRVSSKILDKIKEKGFEGDLFKTRIRKNVTISEGQLESQNIFDFQKKSTGAQDYVALGDEVLRKIKKLK